MKGTAGKSAYPEDYMVSHKQTAKDAPWEDKNKPFDENMYKYHENTNEYDP
jgi:ATP-dependent phosphoenolpyruvate carboxykinase